MVVLFGYGVMLWFWFLFVRRFSCLLFGYCGCWLLLGSVCFCVLVLDTELRLCVIMFVGWV